MHAIGKERVLRIWAEVGEGEDGNGFVELGEFKGRGAWGEPIRRAQGGGRVI